MFLLGIMRTDFYDFYGQVENVKEYKDIAKVLTRFSLSYGNIYISSSVFRDCYYGDNGGALYLSTSSTTLLFMEEVTFINCKSYGYGGAVYLSISGGKSFLSKICASECLGRQDGTSHGQCLYISVCTDMLYNNYVNDSSISNCKNNHVNSYYTQYIRYGRILLTRENISYNGCSYYTALYSYSDQDSACTNLCSFVNNTADSYACLHFNSPQEIHNCNILFNEQKTASYGMIYANSNLYIFDSCILENNKNKTVFYANTKIELYKCTVDSYSSSGSLVVRQENEKDFINGIRHLNMNICEASFDAVGTLTADVNKGGNRYLSVAFNRKANGSGFELFNSLKYAFINAFLSFEMF
jgi:hypothetical protein